MNLTLPGRTTLILSVYLILTGVFIVGGIFLWGSYNELRAEYEDKTKELARKKLQHTQITVLRTNFEELQIKEQNFKPYFVRNKQEQVVLETLTNLAALNGLSLDSITPRSTSTGFRESAAPSTPEFPVDMQVQGTLAQISSLLEDIEAGYPMIRCTRLGTATVGMGKTTLTLTSSTEPISFQLTFSAHYRQNP